MEYLVIRNLSYVDREAWVQRFVNRKVGDLGQLTFSRKGGTSTSFRHQVNDVFWGAVKEKGVFTKEMCIERKDYTIANETDVVKIRNITYDSLKNDEGYWEKEFNKVEEARKEKLSVHLILLYTKIIEVIKEPFPIEQASPQCGYVGLDKGENRNKYFSLVGRRLISDYTTDEKYYVITNDVTLNLIYFYGGKKTFYGDNIKDVTTLDNDHFIPKSIGGPGIFIENVLPTHSEWNRSKSDKIPRALFTIAKKYLNYPPLTLDNHKWIQIGDNWDQVLERWDLQDFNRNDLFKYEKKMLALYITNIIRNKDEIIQRRFYYEVMREGLKNNIKEVYPQYRGDSFNLDEIYLDSRRRDQNGTMKEKYAVLNYVLEKEGDRIIVKKTG